MNKVSDAGQKPSGGHGDHFLVSVGDMDLVKGLVMYAANEPDSKEKLTVDTPFFGKTDLLAGCKGVNNSLSVIVLLANGNLYTAYPKNLMTMNAPRIEVGMARRILNVALHEPHDGVLQRSTRRPSFGTWK